MEIAGATERAVMEKAVGEGVERKQREKAGDRIMILLNSNQNMTKIKIVLN